MQLLTLMVVGLGFKFAQPVGVWPTAGTSADEQFSMVLATLRSLAYAGIQVPFHPSRSDGMGSDQFLCLQIIAVIGDGAAANVCMFRHLFPVHTFSDPTYAYKGPNPYILNLPMWAVFDPSHLLKVTSP